MSYTPVDDIVAIDLTRHALIEASAGTGKTYTLENLVVRLLKERPDIAIDNILMVTFTEKATSELKIRIQEKLVQEIHCADEQDDANRADGLVQKIRETLDAFDSAAIYTIHGFCHTVLKDFAFENQSLFENELIDDGPLFDTLIKEQMRKVWPAVYGAQLPEMLHFAGFGKRKDRFLALVVDIARHVYRPAGGDDIQPDTQGGCSIAQLRAAIIAQVMALKCLMGPAPAFSEGFGRLNINANSKRSLLDKMVIPLETCLSNIDSNIDPAKIDSADSDAGIDLTSIDENHFSFPDLLELIERLQDVKSSDRQGFACLLPQKWLKAGNNIQVCLNLEAIAQGLQVLGALRVQLAHGLAIEAVKQLQAEAVRVKRQNGWISYDDMLSQVEAALYGDQGAALRDTLRARYKVAFVDEFQDTDPIQWRIFKRLFLEPCPGPADNLLLLIGDPKQAIYSFRGADVYAYLEARNEMERLAQTGRAGLYSLATNWRSKPDLVAAFNDLFGRDPWFPPQAQAGVFEIGYQGAASPNESDLPSMLAADGSLRPALNVVDLSGAASPRLAKVSLARFIAREVHDLVARGGIVIQPKNQTPRPLDFGDICLLVRGRSDALMLERQLTELGIPYSFYKKPGLFFSDEALYLSLMCHAMVDPGSMADVKKALLTPFFTCLPNDLPAYDTLPVTHPLKQLLFYWHDLAQRRRWGRLFQSLLEDSGLVFRQAGSRDWDRSYTNYRQILEHLEAIAYRRNLDFRGLSALLDSYRKQTVGAKDDADIHQIETEAQKVHIMTMHVSKGLQFPVVFIAGGLTQRSADEYHVYHYFDRDDPAAGIRKVIDLSKTCNPEQHEREKYDEDKRLFYVALTRAQFKLYVPYFPAASGHRWVGPVGRFVSQALGAAFPRTQGHPAVAWLTPEAGAAAGSDQDCGAAQAAAAQIVLADVHPLLPVNTDYQSRRIVLESFSSLQARQVHGVSGHPSGAAGFRAVREKDKEDDEQGPDAATNVRPAAGPDDELPGGADIGSMFHDILEQIDYGAVIANPADLLERKETADIIIRNMAAYRVEERWRTQVGRIVADTLTTPIHAPDSPLVLGRLKKEDRIHEVEFFFPHAPAAGAAATVPDGGGERGRPGFIRGFVDLVFRHNGKYFIADWKSNRLDNGYDRQALDACMDAAGYHLQYRLYTVAVLRWLNQACGDRFDAAARFGGVYYFFLRGMGAGNANGVYFVSPAQIGDLRHLERNTASISGD